MADNPGHEYPVNNRKIFYSLSPKLITEIDCHNFRQLQLLITELLIKGTQLYENELHWLATVSKIHHCVTIVPFAASKFPSPSFSNSIPKSEEISSLFPKKNPQLPCSSEPSKQLRRPLQAKYQGMHLKI